MTTKIGDFYICPYNRSHMVTGHKLPNHLVKCRKNNPDLAKTITICPYNQCHHVPTDDLKQHFENCEDYHFLHATSLQPATRDRLPFRPMHSHAIDTMEQEQLAYNSYRDNFKSTPNEDPVQQQRNRDDLDEWFVG